MFCTLARSWSLLSVKPLLSCTDLALKELYNGASILNLEKIASFFPFAYDN